MADQEQLARLKAGVDSWNQWLRDKNWPPRIDLVGADLRNANLKGIVLNRANLSGANLSGANLEGASLNRANLSEANCSGVNLSLGNLCGGNLIKSNFSRANLENSNMSGAYLSQASLSRAHADGAIFRKVSLVGAFLRGACLTRVDFSDAILHTANLLCANLHKADLSSASLFEANLSDANLSQVQALGTDFSRAIFTGACLRNWNLNKETKLEDAQADYVYLNSEWNAQLKRWSGLERRPMSGNFKPGEFAALFQQALDTLDLIFVDGIDWQAFFASFQELRQQYDDADLNIQTIEKKGGSFVVRLEMSEEANKAAIEQSAKAGYEQQLQLLEARYQAQLQLKDAEIESHKRESANMLEITKLLASKPITVEANAVAENKSTNQTNYGGTNFQNDISGGEVNQAETMNINRSSFTNNMQGAKVGNFANQISGNAQQVYNEAPDKSLAEAAQEIQALLDQLSKTYPSETRREKFDLAEAAAEQAKANLTLWQRIVSAIDAGTIAAVGELLSHPAATFFIEAAKDLAETKPQG